MLDYFFSKDEEKGPEKAEQVLSKLETDSTKDAVLDEIDRALTAHYMEGKRAGRLEAEEPESETTMFRLLIGCTVLTGINTLVLVWPIIQAYT